MKQLGKRVADLRKQNGLTAAELATRVAINRDVLANIETGRRQDVGVAQLAAIAWELRVPLVALLLPLDDPHATVDNGGRGQVLDVLSVFQAWPGNDSIVDTTPARMTTTAQLAALRQYRMALKGLMDSLELTLNASSDDEARAGRAIQLDRVALLNEQSMILREMGIKAAGDVTTPSNDASDS